MSASPLFIPGCPIRAGNDVVRGDSLNKPLPSLKQLYVSTAQRASN